jgi:hypothetical protein
VDRAGEAVKESVQEATDYMKGKSEQAAPESKGPEK